MRKTDKYRKTVQLWAGLIGVEEREVDNYFERGYISHYKLYKDTERAGWRWSPTKERWLRLMPAWVYRITRGIR